MSREEKTLANTSTPATKSTSPKWQHSTAYYRTLDQLDNFRIRVCLRKIADRNVPVVKSSTLSLNETENLLPSSSTATRLPPPEQVTIKWQKKIYSPKEILEFSQQDAESYHPNKATYINHIQSLLLNPKSKEARLVQNPKSYEGKMCLFTYIDQDEYEDIEEINRKMTDSAHGEPLSRMAKRSLMMGMNKSIDQDQTKTQNVLPAAHLQKPLRETRFSVMHIMAYLYSDKSKKQNDAVDIEVYEKKLCTIKCFANGLVSMTPGLTKANGFYQFELNHDVFQFTLQNISKELEPADEEKEWSIYKEYYTKQFQIRKNNLPDEFIKPPDTFGHRVFLYGDISLARSFPAKKMYIHYLIELADGWIAESTSLSSTSATSTYSSHVPILSAYTQCSDCIFNKDVGEWEARFACPLEIQLVATRYQSLMKWPKIYLEVCSMDGWDRHVVEGYGYLDIPRVPGRHAIDIPTWKPVAGIISRMKSYFIGGSSELEDIAYEAIPTGHQGSRLTKYGFQTETSGVISVNLNIAHQSSAHISELPRTDDDMTGYIQNNIRSISDALNRARQKLDAMRAQKKND